MTKAEHTGSILRKNMPELDAVRGVAIALVVIYHAFFWSNQGAKLGGLKRTFILATQPGWLGVDLFFVLSGFLISGLLIDAKTARTKRFYVSFYMRRALRILPLYYLVLLVAGTLLFLNNGVSFGFLAMSAVYLSNVAMNGGYPVEYPLAVLWSLAVEEQFYLTWPTLIRVLSFNYSFFIVIALCLVEPIIRALSFIHWGYVERGTFILTWYRLDSFAWGASLAFFLRSSLFTRTRFKALAVLLLGGSVALVLIGFPYGITTRTRVLGTALQFTCAAMFFAGLMATVLLIGSSGWVKLVTWSWLRYLGRISYCLYLIHQICFWSFDKIFGRLNFNEALASSYPFARIWLRAGIVVVIAVALSDLSRRYFELPFLNLKRRFAL